MFFLLTGYRGWVFQQITNRLQELCCIKLIDDALIAHYVEQPPQDTRAYFRSECLKRYRNSISHANWDVLTFDLGDHRERKVLLSDPTKGTRVMVQALLDNSPDAKVLLDNLALE